MSYQQFEKKWLGKRVDTDYYPKGHVYQCVDLIKQYMRETQAVPYGAYGDAIHYWTKTHPNVLKKFGKVKGSSAKKGDIVVLKGLSGNPYGHVGIATGKITGNDLEILEQNGSSGNGSGTGGNAIRKRWVPRSRVAGLLRPKGSISKPVYYIVKAGDNLTKIAKQFKTTVAKLVSLNKIKNPNLIFKGQKIRTK